MSARHRPSKRGGDGAARPKAIGATTTLLRGEDSVPPRAATIAVGQPSIDIAIAHIRDILGRTVAKGMEDVGAYLLRTFYSDDPAVYHSLASSSHLSLRALVDRCGTLDLPVSASFLSTSIRMAVVARRLPAGASFSKLPVSHRVELLRLPEAAIELVAADALGARLPVRELRTKVTELLVANPPTRGRPREPRLIQLAKNLERALPLDDQPNQHAFAMDPAEIARLSLQQRKRLKATLDRTRRVIEELGELIDD